MYNADLPTRAELPTTRQLRRSTIIAAASAVLILLTVVLPSEYAVDPTGIGRVLGFTQMGEIKTQLAAEAAADAAADKATISQPQIAQQADNIAAGGADEVGTLVRPPEASVSNAEQVAAAPTSASTSSAAAQDARNDEISITLKPGQGAEVKLSMLAGAKASFSWTANGAVVNYDTHGDGGGQSISYEKGRGVANDEGTLEAAFDGNHGWFWRNRTQKDVTVTLRTSGDYAELKRMI